MRYLNLILLFLLLITSNTFSQGTNQYPVSVWKLTELSGGLGLQANYNVNDVQSELGSLFKAKKSSFSGILNFNSKSYIWHPNLIELEVNASYNPSAQNYDYIGLPQTQSSSIDYKNLEVNATFLKTQKLTFSTFLNFNRSYLNIENITFSKRNNNSIGGGIIYKNRFAPITVTYNARKSYLENPNTNRSLDGMGSNLSLSTSKSITKNFNSDFMLTSRTENQSLGSRYSYKSNFTRLVLTNKIDFSKIMDIKFLSRTSFNSIKFNNANNSELQFFERLYIPLKNNLNWTTSSNYIIRNFKGQGGGSFNLNSFVSHRLYKSLFSNVNFSYNSRNNNYLKQKNYSFGINNQYKKIIPLDGTLSINHNFNKRINNTKGLLSTLEVFDQEYILSDSQLILLANSNINEESIIVKNNASTLIYQENIDYSIIKTGDFIEILRIPGGLIQNNSTVLISYTADQLNNYRLNSYGNSFGVNINLFKGVFNLHYNLSKQNFDNSSQINYEVQNYSSQYNYGGSINYRFFKGSVEYRDVNSDVVPYTSLSYNANINGYFKKNLVYNINYRLNDYRVIQEEGRTEKREFLNGMIAYKLSRNSRLNLNIGVNNRKSNDIEVKGISGSLSLSKSIGAINLLTNISYYNANSNNITSKYIGGNISIIRNF